MTSSMSGAVWRPACNQLAEALLAAMGSDLRARAQRRAFGERGRTTVGRHVPRQELLGFEAEIGLEEGLRRLVARGGASRRLRDHPA